MSNYELALLIGAICFGIFIAAIVWGGSIVSDELQQRDEHEDF